MAEEEINDRFTTYWGGEFDPRAMQYAMNNGITFYDDSSTGSASLVGGNGFFISSGGGQFSWARLRAANRASGDEVRARHAADQEITTSRIEINIIQGQSWYDATRGQKLRHSQLHKMVYEAVLKDMNDQIQRLEADLRNNEDAEKSALLQKLRGEKPNLLQMLAEVENLRLLVVDESRNGWDWEAGLEAQKAVRREQRRLDKGWYEKVDPVKIMAMWHQIVGDSL